MVKGGEKMEGKDLASGKHRIVGGLRRRHDGNQYLPPGVRRAGGGGVVPSAGGTGAG